MSADFPQPYDNRSARLSTQLSQSRISYAECSVLKKAPPPLHTVKKGLGCLCIRSAWLRVGIKKPAQEHTKPKNQKKATALKVILICLEIQIFPFKRPSSLSLLINNIISSKKFAKKLHLGYFTSLDLPHLINHKWMTQISLSSAMLEQKDSIIKNTWSFCFRSS